MAQSTIKGYSSIDKGVASTIVAENNVTRVSSASFSAATANDPSGNCSNTTFISNQNGSSYAFATTNAGLYTSVSSCLATSQTNFSDLLGPNSLQDILEEQDEQPP